MKIGTNLVGNYHPVIAPKITAVQPKQEPKVQDAVISGEERNFFLKMYPERTNDIIDYHFYQPDGRMSGVSKGTMLDRRG